MNENENFKWITFRFNLETYENVIIPALELMRLRLGNYMVNGLPVEASNSRCIELICAEFISTFDTGETEETKGDV